MLRKASRRSWSCRRPLDVAGNQSSMGMREAKNMGTVTTFEKNLPQKGGRGRRAPPRGGGATHVRPAAACWQARPARRRSPRRWGRAVRRGAGRKRSGAQASPWAQPAPAGPSACGGLGASRGHGLAWIIGARRGFLGAPWPGRGHRPERPQRALGAGASGPRGALLAGRGGWREAKGPEVVFSPPQHRREGGRVQPGGRLPRRAPVVLGRSWGRTAGGVSKAQVRARTSAQQGLAPDGLQPPLLRRSGFRPQVKPGVRGLRRYKCWSYVLIHKMC